MLFRSMGGTVLELESERLIKCGKAQMIIELGQEEGVEDGIIIDRLQKRLGLSLEKARTYLAEYGK